MGFQVAPLSLEFELDELGAFNLIAQFVARAFDGSGLTQRQIAAPICPHHVLVRFFEGHEQREFIKPGGMLPAEGVVGFTVGWPTPLEGLKRPAKKRNLPSDDGAKVHVVRRKLRLLVQVASVEIAAFDEDLKADQQGIAGKRREALVGRITITGWAERQDLPDVLSRIAQKVREAVGLRPKLTHAISAGKRCR